MDQVDARRPWTLYSDRQRVLFLTVLFFVSALNNLDKSIIMIVLEPIKASFGVSDTQLGLLSGFSFSVLYATLGLPVARLADRWNRKHIVAGALLIWSGMTVLCGAAQSFAQLVIARIGVGAGEAGGIPPSQSLIADYFPPERRARAIAIFAGSLVLGYLLGLTAGAQIAAHYGWRWTLVAAGTPGLLLAVVVHFVLREPRARLGVPPAAEDAGMFRIMGQLLAKRSVVHLLLGITVYNMFSTGVFSFVPSYLIRIAGVPLGTVGLYYGAASAASALIGISLGGLLVGRIGARDPRWQAWLCAAGLFASTPFFAAGFLISSFPLFLGVITAGLICLNVAYGVMYTALHAVCGSHRRAVAVAMALFASNFFGVGLGPFITGLLSDLYGQHYGTLGLRYALLTALIFLPLGGAFMLRAGTLIPADLEG